MINDDDTPSILQRQMSQTAVPVISLKAMRFHGLVNPLFESQGALSLGIQWCEQLL